MTLYRWLPFISLAYLIISFIIFSAGLLPSKWRLNPAPPLGKKLPGIIYSFTGAMSPAKKESAYLHLPTYTAGIVFHIGLFSAIITLFLTAAGVDLPKPAKTILILVFTSGTICGFSIMIKRIINPVLKSISNADDYISNILVTLFQLISAMALYNSLFIPSLMIFSSLLIIYIPAGKLRHSFYFFSSRVALGIFYGSRGVWGTKKSIK